MNGSFKLKPNMRWAALKDLEHYPMPSGSAKIVEKIKESL
jgi:hypothetical protein